MASLYRTGTLSLPAFMAVVTSAVSFSYVSRCFMRKYRIERIAMAVVSLPANSETQASVVMSAMVKSSLSREIRKSLSNKSELRGQC